MANLSDSDLLLVNRSNKSYKVTGAELKDYYVKQPTISSVVLTEKEDLGADRFNEQSFISTVTSDPGRPPAEMSIRGVVNAQVIDKLETSAITNVGTADSNWNLIEPSNGPGNANYYAVTYGKGKFVAVSANNTVMYSTDGNNWTITTDGVPNRYWSSVAYGGDKYVAVSNTGSGSPVMYSTNGITWTTGSLASYSWQDVAYGEGRFVAVSTSGSNRIYYSDNGGNNWTAASGTGGYSLTGIAYGNGVWVAVNNSNTASQPSAYYSTNNGVTWNDAIGTNSTSRFHKVSYGGGKFVAVARTGSTRVMYSEDGINWTIVNTNLDDKTEWRGVAYGGGVYTVVGYNGKTVMYSTDLINWTLDNQADINGINWFDVTFGDGKFVAVAQSGSHRAMWSYTGGAIQTQLTFTDNKDLALFQGGEDVVQSDDAASGTVAVTDAPNNTMRLLSSTGTWANGQTVIGPPRPLTTSEITGLSAVTGGWNPIGTSNGVAASNWRGVAYGKGTFVAISSNAPNVMYSTDGINWTVTNNGVEASNWYDITYGNNKFVAVANGGTYRAMYSSDGIKWTATNNGVEANSWRIVTYGGGKFVAIAGSGTNRLMYSSDGIKWTAKKSGYDDSSWYDITYGDGKFVAVAYGGNTRVMYSSDGINWTGTTNGVEANNWYSVTYGAGKFVAVSHNGTNRVMYSTDAIKWTPTKSGVQLDKWRGVTYGGGKFVAVASDINRSMYSPDGVNWTATSDGVLTSNWYRVTYGDGKFVSVSLSGSKQCMWSLTGGPEEPLLTFADNRNLALFEQGDPIKQDDDDAAGFVANTNTTNNTMQVSVATGAFSTNTGNFVIGPDRASTKEAQMFCKLNNSLEVIDLQETNPGYTKYTGTTPTIKFPYYLPNGEPVDSTLLPGSSIYTQVKADNLATPEVTKKSNTVTPASTCIAGPITTAEITGISSFSPENWTYPLLTGSGDSSQMSGIAYGDDINTWVACASDKGSTDTPFYYSTDSGETFTAVNPGTTALKNAWWSDVAYGDNKFVAISGTGANGNSDPQKFAYSTDGLNWTILNTSNMTNISANTGWQVIEYHNGMFVAAANSGGTRLAWSETGLKFTGTTVGANEIVSGLTWGRPAGSGENGRWLEVGYGANRKNTSGQSDPLVVAYSDDNGRTWTETKSGFIGNGNIISTPPKFSATDCAYGNGIYVIVGAADNQSSSTENVSMYWSDDGINFNPIDFTGTNLNTEMWKSVNYGGGYFLAAGRVTSSDAGPAPLVYSYNGKDWFEGTPPSQMFSARLTYGAGNWFMVSDSGTKRITRNSAPVGITELTFVNAKGLDELEEGISVDQNDNAASAVVSFANIFARTLKVVNVNGTFSANTGNYLIGPNRVCPPITFDASDPADVAQFEAIQASFEGYETSKKLHRASLMSRMIVAGFTEQQISAFDLDTADVALNLNGYYPLYTTEAVADAAGNGSSHAHVIDGVTYYMPDGGVPIYHGSYNEPEDTTSDSTDSSSTDTTDSGSTDSTDSDSTDTTDSNDSGSTDSGSSSSGGSYGY